jgi:hypothetical protein
VPKRVGFPQDLKENIVQTEDESDTGEGPQISKQIPSPLKTRAARRALV